MQGILVLEFCFSWFHCAKLPLPRPLQSAPRLYVLLETWTERSVCLYVLLETWTETPHARDCVFVASRVKMLKQQWSTCVLRAPVMCAPIEDKRHATMWAKFRWSSPCSRYRWMYPHRPL